MSWRCLEDAFARRLEDVLKTYGQDEHIGLDQDAFWRRRRITSSSRRMFAMVDPSNYVIWSKFFLRFLIISEIMMKMINIIMCQYMQTVHCSHHINAIIWVGLNESWFVITKLLVINWGWLIGEKLVLPGCLMCFALRTMFFTAFKTSTNKWIFLFFSFCISKDGKKIFLN